MKNYKNLVPIILVVLFALGIYMKYDKNTSLLEEYNTYLNAARQYRELEIAVDAEENYLQAIELKPSVKLYIEVGEFYNELYGPRRAMKWGEELIEVYPDDVRGYEFLLGVYKNAGRYEDFFDMYSIVVKRGITSEVITEYVGELNNTYFFDGEYSDVGYFAGGYCKVQEDGLWCYISAKGKVVTKPNYTKAGNFCDEVAPVEDQLGEVYFTDAEGNKKFVVQNVSSIKEIGSYDEELCTIYDGKEWGIYTLEGELKHGGYSNVSALGNGVVAVEKSGKWSILDYEGNKLISDTFDSVKTDEKGIAYRNSRLFVEVNNKYYMIDSEGNKITKTAYDDVKIFNGDGYAAVKIGEKWGFIDAEGEVVIDPQYEDARSFSNGYAAVKKGDLWGFIDAEGKTFIKCQFSDATDFTSAGSVFVKVGKWRLLRLYAFS